ncbi:hypothetical protein ACEPAG_5996 [Sanghuangporus baumii]
MANPLVQVTVEHPQYMQTFVVCVPPAGTVSDIKHEIAQACPGNPRVEGQRLISKGRVLDDGERVESLWAAPDDARVVHLAVNPSSWSTSPPKVPAVDETVSPALQAYEEMLSREVEMEQPLNGIPTTPPPMLPQFQTLPFISYLHHRALRALSPSTPPAAPGADGSESARAFAKAALRAANYPWPEIFDVEFPGPSEGGVTYDFTLVGGKPFLENLTPYATPTSRQQHALNVLSYTFPLLTLDYSQLNANTTNNVNIINTVHNNAIPQPNLIQNLNAGVARADANGRNVVAVRVNMRELLTPLVLLFIRTLILLYFFSPARKPVFGILLGAYILYEAWGAVRGAIFDIGPLNGNDNRARQNERRRPAQAGNGAAPTPPPQNGMPPAQNPGAAAAANVEAAIEHLAQAALDLESRWLETDAPDPGLAYRIIRFVFLLVLSVHPAFWNRRRAALRAREGRLRTEANAIESAARQQAEGESSEGGAGDERARQARQQIIQRNERRPAWIREYIDRVRRGDWVDD